MKKVMAVFAVLLVATVAIAGAEQGKNGNQVPSIEGTWQLISRDLPDGSSMAPPAVLGLLTFADGYRNFNVMWKDKEGAKSVSIAIISKYKLTSTEYTETNVYYMKNDEIGGTGISYDISQRSASAPVTVKDGKYSWGMPLFEEPAITYEGDNLVAKGPGFVDHWKRIK